MSKLAKAGLKLFAAFKTDTSLETKGVVLQYPGLRLTIARAGGANKAFATLLNARLKPYKRAMDDDTMDNEVAAQIMRQTYADKIILYSEVENADGTWVPGCVNSEGEIVQANQAGLCGMFEALPDLFRDVQIQASAMGTFRAEQLAETAKN